MGGVALAIPPWGAILFQETEAEILCRGLMPSRLHGVVVGSESSFGAAASKVCRKGVAGLCGPFSLLFHDSIGRHREAAAAFQRERRGCP